MSEKDTGGPAFPEVEEYDTEGIPYKVYSSGMTLRDFFAGQASEEDIKPFLEVTYSRSEARYAHADDMINQRSKE